jgi:hypothetical protein
MDMSDSGSSYSSDSSQCGYDDCPFRSAQTFDELLELNLKFVRGELSETSYHLAPLSDETMNAPGMVDRLIEFHERGVMTIGSQPGMWRTTLTDTSGLFVEARQMPYLQVVMRGDVYRAMERGIDGSFVDHQAHFPPSGVPRECVAVTDRRTSSTLEELKSTPWESHTRIHHDYSREIEASFPGLARTGDLVEAYFWVEKFGFDTNTFLDTLLRTL